MRTSPVIALPIALTLAFACVSLAAACATAAGAEDPPPNIILAMADDQGWGDMAYNGHPALKTPNFDAMAEAGLRFDHFYAAAPVCSPTRGSVLTGRHPNRFGCFKWGYPLRPQEITIAEALGKAGYATAHFGKWHLGSVREGSPVNPGASGFETWFSAPNYYDNDPIMSREGRAVQTHGESSQITVDAALAFVQRCDLEKKPFFLVVWFGSPHAPHQAIEEDRALYADQPENVRDFYGEITGMDRAVGRIRQELRGLGIEQNTLFWYCSDNGALKVGSSGGLRGNKGQVYDGGLQVPAIIEWPARIPKPRVTSVRCNTTDIYPTILELTGAGDAVESQPVLDGVSLVPLLDGKMETRPAPMGFWDYKIAGMGVSSKDLMAGLLAAQQEGREPDDRSVLRMDAGALKVKYSEDDRAGHAAWIDGDWKLHRLGGDAGDTARYELYHLAEDRAEEIDRFAAEPARAEKMKASLEEWQRSVIRSLNGADDAP